MKVLSQIDHFVLKLDNSFLIKLFVFQSHLLFHEQQCVNILILLIILLYLLTERLRLANQIIDGLLVASHDVVLSQCLLIKSQILLKVRQVMVSLQSLPLQKLYLISLTFVRREHLLHIVHVIIPHLILSSLTYLLAISAQCPQFFSIKQTQLPRLTYRQIYILNQFINMSNHEEQFFPLNPLTAILIGKEKSNIQSTNSTQSTISKPPQGAKIISSYLLGRNIGVGTFGKVYMAMHLPTSEKVAIKVIDKQKITSKVDVNRVKCQIQILKTVRHRHIINLYQIIQTEKSVLLVMEYISNGELFQHIIKQKKLGQNEACLYFQQIISAVQYIHRNKIAHRDLKPQNILIDFDKQLKLIDFGLGAFYSNHDLKTFCGSPCYAAPEMIAAKKQYDPKKVDLWSCGIILFSMVCGHLPFCDTDTKTLYKKILSGVYKIPAHVSPLAKNLIQGLLQLSPNKRMSIQQIQKHKWFNLVPPKQSYGLSKGEFISIDNDLLCKLAPMGIKGQSLKAGIIKNERNKDTAAYYILMKKLFKNGELIPSFIGHDNFNPKLIQKLYKKFDEDTQSVGSFDNPVPFLVQSLMAPDAPELPPEQKVANPGSSQNWYPQHFTEDKLKYIDQIQVTLFAQNILDVVVSKYMQGPKIQQIAEILQHDQSKPKQMKRIIREKREDQFYTDNKAQRKKVLNFKQINQDQSLNVSSNKLSILQSIKSVPLRHKSNLKRLISLQKAQKIPIFNKVKRAQSMFQNKQAYIFRISEKIETKIDIKIKNLQKIYGARQKNIKLPSIK